jgi:anti-sigma factor ChrR (cupin superfamily)
MFINADFSQRVVIRPDDYQWVPSLATGVERMMLDRIGKETGHATSLVRYAPDSVFPQHVHSGGEEILVLEGEFSDEHGSYPIGSYLRNPIGTKHNPKIGSAGATIFVKLHQFDEGDTRHFNIDTSKQPWRPGLVKGLSVMPLHEFDVEHVALVKWAPFTKFQPHSHFGGEEIFVISGTFHDEHGAYPAGSWIRSPHLSQHQPYTEEDGALIYVKTGHLIKLEERGS